MGGGSHWICYRNVDKQYCEYFDPFGLIMPNEIKNCLKTSGKKMVYSSDEIQERDCFVWLLVLILPSGEIKGQIIIRRYTQPQIQFHKSNDKSPISDKLFYVIHIYKMTEKFCVYCQEVTPHYVNQYGCFECCNCEPLSESDYESDSSHETYVPDSDQTIII